MSLIYYCLNSYTTCAAFVAAQAQAGIWNDVAVPDYMQDAGIYLIVNASRNLNNRYVGISDNIQQRFRPRLEALHAFGFTQAELNQIYVYWGQVRWWNTNQLGQVPAGDFGEANTVEQLQQLDGQGGLILNEQGQPIQLSRPDMRNIIVGGNAVIGYNPQQGRPCTGNIDNQLINFENLLMRFFSQGLGIGGTMTNTQLQNPITNNTQNDMRVIVGYCRAEPGGNAQNVLEIPANFASFDVTLRCARQPGQAGATW